LQQPGTTTIARTLAAVLSGLVALVLIPGTAAAQDPSVDQYTPTAPSGGGSVPTGSSHVGDLGGGSSSDDGGDAGGATGSSGGGSTPASGSPAVATDTGAAATGGSADGGSKGESRDERTLDGLAASAESLRADDNGGNGQQSAATKLLRSDSGGGSDFGIFLWAALGATALWAVAMVAKRRHDGGGTPA
jgi:hypothetical protein